MRFTPTFSDGAGFSLVELLVALAVSAVVMAAVGSLFVSTRQHIHQQVLQIETDQAVRATLDSLARDLRLSGACLPENGEFVALAGANQGAADWVVTRTGVVGSDVSCIRSATPADALAGTRSIRVETASGFLRDMGVYIRHPDGRGETVVITDVDGGTNVLRVDRPLSRDYPASSGVYAIDERRYAIDTTNASRPVLTIARNGLPPVPFASGVEGLNVQYDLARNCPPCDRVDLPANEAEWALVKQLAVTVTARSSAPVLSGAVYRRVGTIAAKPRNLSPG